jgi:probable addiction module antidote protein
MAAKSKRRKIKVAPYDSADYLKTEVDIKNYLEAVFEEPVDRQMLIHTLGVVARARGMMKLSKDTGITRAGLYKALSPERQSELRDRDEDCRCIRHAAERASGLKAQVIHGVK